MGIDFETKGGSIMGMILLIFLLGGGAYLFASGIITKRLEDERKPIQYEIRLILQKKNNLLLHIIQQRVHIIFTSKNQVIMM